MSEVGDVIAEGKTKIVALDEGSMVSIESKDDITAGDGAKHNVVKGKGAIANATTCNVFRLLQECGLPVAFRKQVDRKTFQAVHCNMIPFEVVVRRESHGSCIQRRPHLKKGQIFPRLVVEFFLKTSGKQWREQALLSDDPLAILNGDSHLFDLYDPHASVYGQEPFLSISQPEGFEESYLQEMAHIAQRAFLILEKAWQLQGRRLVDFKVEFGISASGDPVILLADVIDNDSWRVVDAGEYIDKQAYRDGQSIRAVMAKYRLVRDLTARFRLPSQRIIIWRGSKQDDLSPFYSAIGDLAWPEFPVETITDSMHKEPEQGISLLKQVAQEVPNSVLIVFVGRSNGAGPILSAHITVPAITVPANYREFPDDIMSSLRTPSKVPVMTILEPGNAVLAALQILAMSNPMLYATLRLEQEKRLINTFQLH